MFIRICSSYHKSDGECGLNNSFLVDVYRSRTQNAALSRIPVGTSSFYPGRFGDSMPAVSRAPLQGMSIERAFLYEVGMSPSSHQLDLFDPPFLSCRVFAPVKVFAPLLPSQTLSPLRLLISGAGLNPSNSLIGFASSHRRVCSVQYFPFLRL